MRLLFLSVLLITTIASYAVDFAKLSRNEPVSATYQANFKCYIDVSFFLDLSSSPATTGFVRFSYVIGQDTLNDLLQVDKSYNAVVKRIFLDEGEHLTVSAYLANAETELLDGIDGSLRLVRNPELEPSDDQGKNTFMGSIWKSDQTPLFRIVLKEGEASKKFKLTVKLNENFEYDKLLLKVKVISPVAGIVMVEKALNVNESKNVERRKRSISITFDEIQISQPGSYYFQVMQNMTGARINGVEMVSYELVSE